ncbi:uncharacterized protein B0I36DRAFT_365559 [Microdochium trichocladiopsis]|uniref:Uncharacterized protein n=1 Tax=Microdochium trichocladiopsis TaxID=1682393 RepID=A0A9P9BM45_9PEZI|nr:uncharacterized protein B0I36DRAFT_365559 [Microdochium trichocladiopsis]KAH7025915.1 hypothetical protein B0I36DRAFT_365559 [Microdochium trichocladiopsis]
MTGPRVTVRVSQLVRSISTSPATAVPKTANQGTIITSSKAAAPLSRKYADLLRERNIEWDSAHPRSMTTRSSNRPHPPPQKLRLMQTFSTTGPVAATAVAGLDQVVLPGAVAFDAAGTHDPYASIRVPLLPDNHFGSHAPEVADGPLPTPEISIVAANPELVQAAALTEVEGMNIDGVELKFVHDPEPRSTSDQSGGSMLQDIWKGLVDDVFPETSKTAGKATA